MNAANGKHATKCFCLDPSNAILTQTDLKAIFVRYNRRYVPFALQVFISQNSLPLTLNSNCRPTLEPKVEKRRKVEVDGWLSGINMDVIESP